jgi:hypothetical protein
VATVTGERLLGRRQDDPEAGDSEAQQHLAGREQIGNARRGEHLEFGQPVAVGVRTVQPSTLQFDGVVPDLLPGLAQEPFRAQPVERRQDVIEQRLASPEFDVLIRHAFGEHGVDAFVIAPPPVHEHVVLEFVVADHREQRLRQVVVDVRVYAEQDVPERGQFRWCVERQTPRTRYARSREVGVVRVEVELGEGDVPPVHPGRILEVRSVNRRPHRQRRAPVGAQEDAAVGQPRRQGVGSLLKLLGDLGNRCHLRPHGCTMGDIMARREPVMSGVRSFDPVVLGRREGNAWVAYYRREWRPFLVASVGLVSEGFGMGPQRTLVGAWLVLRANQVWAPYPDNDPDLARDLMRRFYALVARDGQVQLDPVEASRREVEWWRIHRVHQREAGLTEDDLAAAVAHLYSYVYSVASPAVTEAARLRVLAMRMSDEWVESGCDLASRVLAEERRTLVASYAALRDAIDRHAHV